MKVPLPNCYKKNTALTSMRNGLQLKRQVNTQARNLLVKAK